MYMCVTERFEHVICHLISFKLCQGHMPHCRVAQMNEKYVNASCEVHYQHALTSIRQMVDYPVYAGSKSTQATSKLLI